MTNSKEKLFSEFPPISTEQWIAKITADLKGAEFEKKLIWKTNEGFNVRPFYRADDLAGIKTAEPLPGEFPYLRGTKTGNDWLVRQNIQVNDVKKANAKALDVVNKGVSSLGFFLPDDAVNAAGIATLLNGIQAECVELNFITCQRHTVELIHLLSQWITSQTFDPGKCRGSVNVDLIGPILKKGKIKEDWLQIMTDAVEASHQLPSFQILNVNAFLFNNAGSYLTQELGYALAWGNELMLRLTEAGWDASIVAKKIKFNFGIGANYFMEMAKFRAARWLWAEIAGAYGGNKEASQMNSFAQTSSFNQTVFDAHVNLLRTQTEAMSAGIAGVDSLLVSPFDESFKTPDDFSERIARNQQLLLKEEAHFDKITDASGGSYYIEMLTQSIAQQAWKLFLETEEKGFYNMVKTGEIQQAVNNAANARMKAVAQRREILLGTNQYPNFTEKANDKMAKEQKDAGCGCQAPGVETLNTKRLAEDFETLRLATEKSGKIPKAFMLTIGNLAMRLARSQFSCNFFACAGYQVIDNLGFETVEAGVEAARKAKADIIVLCSSDDEYAIFAPETYALTKGRELLVIAGAPACMEELKAQGIEYFINIRSNVLDTLGEFSKMIINNN